MAENKTQPTKGNVRKFIQAIDEAQKREDCLMILDMMTSVTREEPALWGPSIIGFGSYHYVYNSGREGDFFIIGFSPRKQNITLYIMNGFDRYDDLMTKLGKYKVGKSCLYIKRLDDVDRTVLKQLMAESVAYMKKKYS